MPRNLAIDDFAFESILFFCFSAPAFSKKLHVWRGQSRSKLSVTDRQGVENMQNQNMIQSKSLTILGDQMQHEYVAC